MMHVAQVRKVVKATRQAVHILGMSLGFRIISYPYGTLVSLFGADEQELTEK